MRLSNALVLPVLVGLAFCLKDLPAKAQTAKASEPNGGQRVTCVNGRDSTPEQDLALFLRNRPGQRIVSVFPNLVPSADPHHQILYGYCIVYEPVR